jgi:sulfur carrier protein ThiS
LWSYKSPTAEQWLTVLEALKMVGLRRSLLAAAIGTAMISRPAAAQHASSSSLTHTVSVTVPPRVKVQVGAFATTAAAAVKVGNISASTQGLSLSVSATQAWVLSIGSGAS